MTAKQDASPASNARTLADDGVPLRHPDTLLADVQWRLEAMTALFSPDELNLESIAAATHLVEKLEALFERDPADRRLRQFVLQIKGELELVAVCERVSERDRQLAQEVGQWLTIWLQNPRIFRDWLDLRRATADFRQRFED